MRIFESVDAVDVYWNDRGSVTIEQEDRLGDDSQVVVIPAGLIENLCAALKNLITEGPEANDGR